MRASQSQLGIWLRKAVPTLMDTRRQIGGSKKRERCYVFSDLETCCRAFAERWGKDMPWTNDGELVL